MNIGEIFLFTCNLINTIFTSTRLNNYVENNICGIFQLKKERNNNNNINFKL